MQEESVLTAQTTKGSRLQEILETSLIVAGLLISFLLIPHNIGGDGWVRFVALSELLTHGKLPYMRYSMVGPLFSTPFWFLGKVYNTPSWWCERFNSFVFAAGLLSIYFLLRNQMDRRLLRTFLLILSTASMFPNHLLFYYGEVFTAVGVGVGILAVTVRRSASGWLPVVLAVANTPASIVALGCVTFTKTVMDKRWRYIFVFVVTAGLIVTESWILRGSPFRSGYEGIRGFQTIMPYSGRPGFSYPFFFGLISILFSFGKGLLFFAPGLLLPIRNSLLTVGDKVKHCLYTTYVLWLSFLIGLVLVYSKWWAWYGGMFWGPRFFLFASIPASFALAVRLHVHSQKLVPNILVALVLLLSIWVGINGAIFGQGQTGLINVCIANNYSLEFLCHFVPEFSVLWYPFVHPLREIRQLQLWQIIYIVYSAIVFVYLSLPLLRTIWTQTVALVTYAGKIYLNFQSWHF